MIILLYFNDELSLLLIYIVYNGLLIQFQTPKDHDLAVGAAMLQQTQQAIVRRVVQKKDCVNLDAPKLAIFRP